MSKVLISYRREDSIDVAGRIYDRLRSHFGEETVFMDIDSIPFGVDFRQQLDEALNECDVVLAVMGKEWVGPLTSGERRIDDRNDFVRNEIATA